MRKRLIELLKDIEYQYTKIKSIKTEDVADWLLRHGVIVPPCKVGDKVYFIIQDECTNEKYIVSQRINDVSTRGLFVSTSTLEENCDDFEPYSEIGKTVFLTKEEAENALSKLQASYKQVRKEDGNADR